MSQTLIDRFREFHDANQQVFALFEVLTFDMIATGRTRYGAQTIIETMRQGDRRRAQGDHLVRGGVARDG